MDCQELLIHAILKTIGNTENKLLWILTEKVITLIGLSTKINIRQEWIVSSAISFWHISLSKDWLSQTMPELTFITKPDVKYMQKELLAKWKVNSKHGTWLIELLITTWWLHTKRHLMISESKVFSDIISISANGLITIHWQMVWSSMAFILIQMQKQQVP